MKEHSHSILMKAEAAAAQLVKLAENKSPDAPASSKPVLLAMRASIRRLRPLYTWESIAAMLAEPGIGIRVRPSALRRLMAKRKGKKSKKGSD